MLIRNDFPYSATAIVEVEQGHDEFTFIINRISDTQVLWLRPSYKAKMRYLASDFVIIRIDLTNQTRAQRAVNWGLNLLPVAIAFIASVAVFESSDLLWAVLLFPAFTLALFFFNRYTYKSIIRTSAERIAHAADAKLRDSGIRPGRL